MTDSLRHISTQTDDERLASVEAFVRALARATARESLSGIDQKPSDAADYVTPPPSGEHDT